MGAGSNTRHGPPFLLHLWYEAWYAGPAAPNGPTDHQLYTPEVAQTMPSYSDCSAIHMVLHTGMLQGPARRAPGIPARLVSCIMPIITGHGLHRIEPYPGASHLS
jgi:hypothetical protein